MQNLRLLTALILISAAIYAGYIILFKRLDTETLQVIEQIYKNRTSPILHPNIDQQQKLEKSSLGNQNRVDMPSYNLTVHLAKDSFESKNQIETNVDQGRKQLGILTKTVKNEGDTMRSTPQNTCNNLKSTYSVVPGISWGSLPDGLQRTWTLLKCDRLANKEIKIALRKKDEQFNPNSLPNRVRENRQKSESSSGLPSITAENKGWCRDKRSKYEVRPMKSWGALTPDLISEWKRRRCDLVFTANRMSKRPVSNCSGQNTTSNEKLPLIAVMAATTTRKVIDPEIGKLALFTYLLPSLMRSLDCGFNYEYVLGFDVGDPFYDSIEGMEGVKKWFKLNIEDPLKTNGIKITLRLVKVNNTLKKPGPVFLEMARAAYTAGADYFYRINDDTELINNWATKFVNSLLSLGKPYGAVGPNCAQGNTQILTHDFVSRLHMDIFEMNYYPPELTDWWMDDWISYVYGFQRTFKAKEIMVIHHTGAHGQRYQVDRSHQSMLGALIKSGRKTIRQWMLKNNVPEKKIQAFDEDRYVPSKSFIHSDIPC